MILNHPHTWNMWGSITSSMCVLNQYSKHIFFNQQTFPLLIQNYYRALFVKRTQGKKVTHKMQAKVWQWKWKGKVSTRHQDWFLMSGVFKSGPRGPVYLHPYTLIYIYFRYFPLPAHLEVITLLSGFCRTCWWADQ